MTASLSVVLSGTLFGQFFGGLLGELVKNVISAEERYEVQWWVGFVLVASGMLMFSPFLAMFPNSLSEEDSTDIETEEDLSMARSKHYFVDYLMSLGRLVTNKVFMLSLLSFVFSSSVVLGLGNNFSVFLMFLFNKTSKEAKIGVVLSVATVLTGFFLVAVGAVIECFKIKVKYCHYS